MIIKAKLTEEHIRNGSPRSAMSCPVALALQEQGILRAYVANDKTVCWIEDRAVHLSHDRELRKAIYELDSGKGMQPGELKLDCRGKGTKTSGGILTLKVRGKRPGKKEKSSRDRLQADLLE